VKDVIICPAENVVTMIIIDVSNLFTASCRFDNGRVTVNFNSKCRFVGVIIKNKNSKQS
jgi:hypothetical protein